MYTQQNIDSMVSPMNFNNTHFTQKAIFPTLYNMFHIKM